jgi:hypothetical protein
MIRIKWIRLQNFEDQGFCSVKKIENLKCKNKEKNYN